MYLRRRPNADPPGIALDNVDGGVAASGTLYRQPFPEGADEVFARHSYLCDEVVPWVDAHYRTLARTDFRYDSPRGDSR
jgi:hypothetical protein